MSTRGEAILTVIRMAVGLAVFVAGIVWTVQGRNQCFRCGQGMGTTWHWQGFHKICSACWRDRPGAPG